MEDIKNSNVILIGSKHTNPWVGLFDKRLNFELEYTPTVDQSFVVNHHPAPAEQALYRNGDGSNSSQTYGVIAYLPNLDSPGHVLIIQGLNMAGTQAAAEVLSNSALIGPVLDRAITPKGELRPFELLVETNSIGATAPEAHILASRIHER
jgi:hypothetical protein